MSNPEWPLENELGSPARGWLPDAILSTSFVRQTARKGLELSEEKRAAYWRRRRSFAARKLWTAGLDEAEILKTMRAFARRVAAEAEVRKILMRVEEAVAADAAEALEDERLDEDESGTAAGTRP